MKSDLLDVSTLDLDKLAAMPDSVLRLALRRVLTECAATPDSYAAFESAL